MTQRGAMRALAAAVVGLGMLTAGLSPAGLALGQAKTTAPKTGGTDVLIFKKGTVLTGTIVEETATMVKFTSEFNGLPFTTEYPKSDLREIKRGAAAPKAPPASAPAPAAEPRAPIMAAETPPADSTGKVRYSYISLTGTFGEQISQTPILKSVTEAVKQRAEVIIVEIDNDWKTDDSEFAEDLPDALGEFDEFHRAEYILEVFATKLPKIADDAGVPKPRLVFWVRRAMGGAAFLPLLSGEVYFHPDGKIGGIGNLATMMKGHERVVEKQISLRLKRAIGWVNLSGYPYSEELVRSMTQDWYVCSLKFVDGRPVLFEGMPANPGEELLTDDGKEERKDDIAAIARNEGNDVLTLNERNAKLLGLSRGTVETKTELLAALKLDRGGFEVPGKPEKVMDDWRVGVDRGTTQAKDLWREYAEVQVTGNFEERRRARSTQVQKLTALIAVLKQWDEGMDMFELYRAGIPVSGAGPRYDVLDNMIEKIRMQQRLDRR
jgi:hypothetical protein